MTSIPADRGIVLGNVIETSRIENLQTIAELQKPVDLANTKLQNLLLSSYKLEMIYRQMINMKVDLASLEKINGEVIEIKAEAAQAAMDLGEQIVTSERAIIAAKETVTQTKITEQIESPINFERSQITPVPLSFDSLKFDVQFFQVLSSDDSSTAHASSIASFVGMSAQYQQSKASAQASFSAANTAMRQSTTNMLDGTIVFVAEATHKQADLMSPCVLDPEKSVNAWNYAYPNDQLSTAAKPLFKAAMNENLEKTISIVTGEAKSSSFVGYVHLLKTEHTEQSQMTSSVASALALGFESIMATSSMGGSFGVSSEASRAVTSLLSTSEVMNNVSLQCMGVIPSIKSKTLVTTVQKMKPDPNAIMDQLGAIAKASSDAINNAPQMEYPELQSSGMEGSSGDARTGSQFMQLNNSYMTESVRSLGDATKQENQVIDTNSMMTAFEDFVTKVGEGNCGVPTAFYLKELTKADIAKIYIRRFFPFGAQTQKQARDGQLGISSGENEGN